MSNFLQWMVARKIPLWLILRRLGDQRRPEQQRASAFWDRLKNLLQDLMTLLGFVLCQARCPLRLQEATDLGTTYLTDLLEFADNLRRGRIGHNSASPFSHGFLLFSIWGNVWTGNSVLFSRRERLNIIWRLGRGVVCSNCQE